MTAVPSVRRVSPRARVAAASEPVAATNRWSREWLYFALSISLWCFMPFVRRLLDWRAGAFASIEILSVIPLASVLPLLFTVLKRERLERLSPPLKTFALLWVGAYTYALIVGIFAGRVPAALYSYASFVVPVIAGVWIATQDLAAAATMRRLTIIGLGIGTVVGLYGLAQFISPPPWDVLWVVSSDFQSVGPPEPFMMRVFSTMNSQGPCADFLAMAIILGLSGIGLRAVYMWPMMGALAAALALTLVRSAWIALVVGAVAYLVLSPRRVRTLPMILVFAGFTAFLVVSLPTLLGDDRGGAQITSRISTFDDLGHDSSALDRQSEIRDTLEAANDDPLGQGLGVVGSAAKLASSDGEGRALDSGYLARFYELGYLGFAAYLAVIVGTLLLIVSRLVRSAGRFEAADRVALATSAALCITVLALEAAGDSYDGIVGLFAWIAIGLGLHWNFNPLAKKSLRSPARAYRRREPA